MSLELSSLQPSLPEPYVIRTITKPFEKNSKPLMCVEELVKGSELVSLIDQGRFDFPNFPEAKKDFQVFYFQLKSEFIALQGLFNGMIQIGQPLGVILSYQKEVDTYTLKFYSHDEATASRYFSKISKIIAEEIRFKSILKKVIQNKKVFEAEGHLLRKELFA